MVWFLLAILAPTLIVVRGHQYIGCYIDKADRDLPVNQSIEDVHEVKCSNYCSSGSFMFFGLQNGKECWCGNSYGKHGVAPSVDCNMHCLGDKSATCGSQLKNSVFATDFSGSGIRYVGCFFDTFDRDLPLLVGDKVMSVSRCHSLCKDKSYAYFGLQNGTECWCGNGYGKFGEKPENECDQKCSGDSNGICGSEWANSVYATGNRLVPPIAGATDSLPTEIKAKLAAHVKSHQSVFPASVMCDRCLIAAWNRREGEVQSRTVALKDLTSVVSRYSASVQATLKALKPNANATFEDFEITINGNYAVRSSYLGIAVHVNDSLQVGLVSAEIVAYLVPKHHIFKKEACTKVWFWTKCNIDTIRERIGYQPNEVDSIDQALRSETYKLFAEKLG